MRAALLIALAAAGCAVGDDGAGFDTASCDQGKCDSDAPIRDQLQGRNDHIATWLRAQTDLTEDGRIGADMSRIVTGIATARGCGTGAASIRTFQVSDNLLTGASPFPRLVATVCNQQLAQADELFVATTSEDRSTTGNVDTRNLEMFSWDAQARVYRFYAANVVDDATVRIEVEPARCRECHQTPSDVPAAFMPMSPIMNELTRPWTHWNATPGFTSHDFVVAPATQMSPAWNQMVVPYNGSASDFEQVIRQGHQRVINARMYLRRTRPASVPEVMSLLRPVFCNEQINYATEDFSSGAMPTASFVDPGIRNMYLQVRPNNWPWRWLNDDVIRIGTGPDVRQVAVRGNLDLETEKYLVTVRALTPLQVLRVRALDWQRPVFSSARCDLWKQAASRFETAPPALPSGITNSQAITLVFEAIMAGLQPSADQLVAVARADASTLATVAARLADGTLADADCAADGFCLVGLDAFGALVEDYLTGILAGTPRAELTRERDRRICELTPRFPNKPALPAVTCP